MPTVEAKVVSPGGQIPCGPEDIIRTDGVSRKVSSGEPTAIRVWYVVY